ncbi:MAG: HPr family phosphocarrier protein [Christensenellales bacterium]
MELTIKVAIQKEMMTRQAADIAHRMSEFERRCSSGKIVVNAKSLMGVLSADCATGGRDRAEGPDEAQAVCTLSKLLGA